MTRLNPSIPATPEQRRNGSESADVNILNSEDWLWTVGVHHGVRTSTDSVLCGGGNGVIEPAPSDGTDDSHGWGCETGSVGWGYQQEDGSVKAPNLQNLIALKSSVEHRMCHSLNETELFSPVGHHHLADSVSHDSVLYGESMR